MRPTERDLMVARAVLDACLHKIHLLPITAERVRRIDLAALLESLPEPDMPYVDEYPWTPAQIAKGLRDATANKNQVVIVKSAALRIADLIESLPEPAEHEQAAQDADDTGCWERKPGSGQCGLHLMPLIHRGRCIEGIRAAARAEGKAEGAREAWHAQCETAEEARAEGIRSGARKERERCAAICIKLSNREWNGSTWEALRAAASEIHAAQDEPGGKGE